MRTRFLIALLSLPAAGVANVTAADRCGYRQTEPSQFAAATRFVSRDNWLAAEHLRIGLQEPQRFMPGVFMRSLAKGTPLLRSASPLDAERQRAVDPEDGKEKSLRFLLDTRLYADGIIVLHAEQVVLESYGPGLAVDSPRLLLQGTRPILSALLAQAAAQGKISREKSIVRVLPGLAKQANLRKTSVQRLLEGETGLIWSEDDRRQWLSATGWGGSGEASAGVRAWLAARRNWPRDPKLPVSEIGGPAGELLTWALGSAARMPASHVFCEGVLSEIGAEDEAFWATDPAGSELADGLALSLRDFAKFGLALFNASSGAGTGSVAPKWFTAAIAAAVDSHDPTPEALHGLGDDIAWRYRFVSLGRAHQAALVGPYGNSLFIDFDRKVIVAIYASFPRDYSPLLLQSLRSVWSALAATESGPGKDATGHQGANRTPITPTPKAPATRFIRPRQLPHGSDALRRRD